MLRASRFLPAVRATARRCSFRCRVSRARPRTPRDPSPPLPAALLHPAPLPAGFGSSSGSSSAKPFSAPPSVDELKKSAQRATGPDALPNQGYVPDVDGLVGRARREAVYKRVYGEDLHDVEPKQYMEEGTRENPIPILSTESERLVGGASLARPPPSRVPRDHALTPPPPPPTHTHTPHANQCSVTP